MIVLTDDGPSLGRNVFGIVYGSASNDSGNNSANTYYNLNKSLIFHQRNLQLLMIEVFKKKNDLNPPFMKDIFAEIKSYYSLQKPIHLQLPKVRTTIYGTENA